MASRTLAFTFALLSAPARGTFVQSNHRSFDISTAADQSTSCPSTTIYGSVQEDAAGTPIWNECPVLTEPGKCFNVGRGGVKLVKVCGPIKLTISRMSCNHHDYKTVDFDQSGSDFTASVCQTYSLAGTNVDGHIGSASFTCS